MEYKKEYDKFSFGIGTEKVAGRGSLSDTKPEKSSLCKAILPLALTVATRLVKSAIRKKLSGKK